MKLNKLIDHTLLKADATSAQIKQLCQEAKDYDFKSVCVNPAFVPQAAELLKGSDVEVCTVIGFPLGANTTATKIFEAKDAIANGATEVDMVINISQAKDGQWEAVEEEIKQIAEAVKGKAILKVIVETALLTDEEIKNATEATVNAGADFVKTSTGFSNRGASLNDVQIMNTVTQGKIGIKASGGVSNRQDALNMVEAGATRIGASKGIQIVSE